MDSTSSSREKALELIIQQVLKKVAELEFALQKIQRENCMRMAFEDWARRRIDILEALVADLTSSESSALSSNQSMTSRKRPSSPAQPEKSTKFSRVEGRERPDSGQSYSSDSDETDDSDDISEGDGNLVRSDFLSNVETTTQSLTPSSSRNTTPPEIRLEGARKQTLETGMTKWNPRRDDVKQLKRELLKEICSAENVHRLTNENCRTAAKDYSFWPPIVTKLFPEKNESACQNLVKYLAGAAKPNSPLGELLNLLIQYHSQHCRNCPNDSREGCAK